MFLNLYDFKYHVWRARGLAVVEIVALYVCVCLRSKVLRFCISRNNNSLGVFND